MSDVSNRDELEKRFARAISKVFRGMSASLIAALGDPPNIANLPPEFWKEFGEELSAELTPFLERVFVQQATGLMDATIAVDWTLVNRAAVDFASRYTFDLVSSMRDGDQQLLQSAISDFFEQGQARGALEERLLRQFGPVRAEMIAVTEVTRAAAEGERAIADELRRQGVDLKPVWQTNNDSLVCPICGPRHNKEITDGIYPPAHPRCRCWVNHEIRT